MKKIFLAMIHLYQRFISPLTPPTRCFYPTCSEYTREVTRYHGAFRSPYLDVRRILRCRPLYKGGFDPVSLKKDKPASKYLYKHSH